MAAHTDPKLQRQVIYSIYVRSHTPEGTFRAVIPDLDRIKALGTDIIWFMPIHPIGVEGKKGSLGCPYANRDYREVNPAYGTMEDFRALVDEIHARGMKCMIDVVYNHTSPDSVLYNEHPEFFYYNAAGKPGNKMGDWADVIDLDYNNRALWQYLTDTLVMWAKIVDGFRCDVASFVPVEFWRQARNAVAKVNPDCIWLAETVHLSYGCLARRQGIYSALDYDAYSAFDMEYEYDVREVFDKYLRNEAALSHYTDMLNFQEGCYPANYNKLRFLENHDRARAAHILPDEKIRRNWTAFLFFQRGLTMIYNGQEVDNPHVPSLFDKDPINWNTGRDQSAFLAHLAELKRDAIFAEGSYTLTALPHDVLLAVYEKDGRRMAGLFSLRGESALVRFPAPNGVYQNCIDGSPVEIYEEQLAIHGEPIVLAF